MIKSKSRKKQIIVISVIGLFILGCVIYAITSVLAAERFADRVVESKIYLEQMYEIKDYQVKRVEVVDSKDKALILKMLDERHTTTDTSGGISQCGCGAYRIVLQENDSIFEFYPATDGCGAIFYDDQATSFSITREDRKELDLLCARYSFPVFPEAWNNR